MARSWEIIFPLNKKLVHKFFKRREEGQQQ